MAQHKHVKLCRSGGSQTVRIPPEFELPGNEAVLRRQGDRLVIEPVRKHGLVALLKAAKPLDVSLPAIDDPVPPPKKGA